MGGRFKLAGGLAVGLLGCAFLVAPADGWAQKPDAATQAKAHYELGMTAYGLGHYDRAVQAFLQAYEIDPAPILFYNVAQAYWKKRDYTPALMFYRRYLEADPRAKNRAQVRSRIRELEAQEKAQEKSQPPAPSAAEAAAPKPSDLEPPPISAPAAAAATAGTPEPLAPSGDVPAVRANAADTSASLPVPAAHSPHAALGSNPTATPGNPDDDRARAESEGSAIAPSTAVHSPHAALGTNPTATPGSPDDERAAAEPESPAPAAPAHSPHAALGSSPTGTPPTMDPRARAERDRAPAAAAADDARERGRVALAREPDGETPAPAPVTSGVEATPARPPLPPGSAAPVVPPALSAELFTPAPPRSRNIPVHRKPWFWPTMGAVSLLTAAAVFLLRPDSGSWTCGQACMSTREIP